MTERYERMRWKRRTIHALTTKLLTHLEEEVSNDPPDCEKLCEMLSVLSTKEETLMDLDKGIKNETPLEELEAEVAAV